MSNEMKALFSGKIAIATDDQKRVTGHIGRCRGFAVYEINDGKILNKEVRENLFTNIEEADRVIIMKVKARGGGRHSHEHLINGLKDCSYLISSGGGWRVVEDLKQHNIATLFTDVELIEDAVNKFIKGELKNETDLVCDHSEH